MELVSLIVGKVNGIVWGPIMLTLLMGTVLFLSVKTGFLQFVKF